VAVSQLFVVFNAKAHILPSYPSDQEKQKLCQSSKLNEKQVMNWFVNNRKRIWQPMKRAKEQSTLKGVAK
jgi:hypothetical protein